MDGLSLIMVLLVGLALGTALGWLLARGQSAEVRAEARAAEERAAYAEERMAERFRALSHEALDATNQRFLELAEGRLRAANLEAGNDLEQRRQAVEHLVAPLRETLARVESQMREVDAGRRAAHAELVKQVDLVREGSERLRGQTQALVTALRRPEARGRWGELQLRRVVELAGMASYCDFEEQVPVTADTGKGSAQQRPDLVVRLAGGKSIVVDSKVPLSAYLEAVETEEPERQSERLAAHARQVRRHVDALSSKSYWAAFSPAPEFVVLFIPGEAFLAPALEHDSELLEYAMRRRVHVATPTTLISLLRTAHYAWQQESLSENARAVFETGKQLHERLATLGGHLDGLGKSLARSVSAFNQTVGSLENRVLVSARRFTELGLVETDPPVPQSVAEHTRPLTAPELLDPAEAHGKDGETSLNEEMFGPALGGEGETGRNGAGGEQGGTGADGYGESPQETHRVI